MLIRVGAVLTFLIHLILYLLKLGRLLLGNKLKVCLLSFDSLLGVALSFLPDIVLTKFAMIFCIFQLFDFSHNINELVILYDHYAIELGLSHGMLEDCLSLRPPKSFSLCALCFYVERSV